MQRYQRLLFDADGTLFDFDRAESPGKSGGIEPDLLRVQAAGDFDGKRIGESGLELLCSTLQLQLALDSPLQDKPDWGNSNR